MRAAHMKRLLFGGVAGLLAAVLTLSPAAAYASTRTMRSASSVMTSGSDPTITNCDGRQEAFEVSSGVLLHRWQTSVGGSWSGWYSLGGYLIYTRIAVFDNVTCHLEVVGVGGDGAMWHIWQTKAGSGPWSGWASLGGGYFTGGPTSSGVHGCWRGHRVGVDQRRRNVRLRLAGKPWRRAVERLAPGKPVPVRDH